ncbi:lytic transglycosylase [Desulfonema ishimotonii]|uniref:Lytic transglycosylase n=1 Tax=Desulfonema ishimotonii TaxID=45657 RepID=A0A401G479_9BACT|nr:LysM peptidoglycan-binding domain-containing protein [Desulfonema ishimotonii]GBC64049.1 lytic transglycosylase [Desulfonema ishimotonii]
MNRRLNYLAMIFLILMWGCAGAIQPRSVPLSAISDTPETLTGQGNSACTDDNTNADTGDFDEEFQQTDSDGEIQVALDEALTYCRSAQSFWQKGDIDNALEALDQAYALLLNVNDIENPKLMRQKEDLRFMISKRILEIYASRNISVKGKHDAIPLTINKYVKKELARFSKSKFFRDAYKRSGKYRPFIVEELKKNGLPVELSWLPLIESGFNVHALSGARALGLWQFIPSTGYKFGLNRDRYIDERMNPRKSTKAAIAYLKELHQIFGDWTTVLAAYNCGEGRVLKVIRSQQVNYLDNFWDLYEKLPGETACYVPRFLATLHIVSHPEKYGLDKLEVSSPQPYEEVSVSKQVSLKDVAKAIGVCADDLKALNPELRQKIVPPGKYTLRIPVGKSATLLAELGKIPVSHTSEPVYRAKAKSRKPVFVYHRIKRGDTLSQIAKRYHTTSKKIRRVNKIYKRDYLVAGNILKIPQKNVRNASKSSKSSRTGHRGISTHVVKKGDSLWNIARKYGISTRDLHRVNKLRGNRLSIGQVLKIPKNRKIAKSSSARRLKTYRVKNGDVPVEIARRYNMSLKRFLYVNRLTPRSKIYPGQRLYVE